MSRLSRPDHTESKGQTLAEYAVALGVITVGIVLAMVTLTGAINALVNRVSGFFGA